MGRRVSLPTADLTLARLTGRKTYVHRLLHRLINYPGGKIEERADSGGLCRTQMSDVIDAVLVQADRADQIDLNFVGRCNSADQINPRSARALAHCQNRWDVVAGMSKVSGEKRVVHVQLAHSRAIGPGRPFWREAPAARHTVDRSPILPRMCQGHAAGGDHRRAIGGSNRNCGNVDDAVGDHLSHIHWNADRVRGNSGYLPGQLIFFRKARGGRINAHIMQLH